MKPINNEGQTVKNGHRWYLDKNGDVDNFIIDYDYHNGPMCRERDCYGGGCISCEPDLYTEICPVASISPYLPLEINV